MRKKHMTRKKENKQLSFDKALLLTLYGAAIVMIVIILVKALIFHPASAEIMLDTKIGAIAIVLLIGLILLTPLLAYSIAHHTTMYFKATIRLTSIYVIGWLIATVLWEFVLSRL